MSRLIDERDAQVLPPVGDERVTVTGWAAHQAVDADHRVKHRVYADLAARLRVLT